MEFKKQLIKIGTGGHVKNDKWLAYKEAEEAGREYPLSWEDLDRDGVGRKLEECIKSDYHTIYVASGAVLFGRMEYNVWSHLNAVEKSGLWLHGQVRFLDWIREIVHDIDPKVKVGFLPYQQKDIDGQIPLSIDQAFYWGTLIIGNENDAVILEEIDLDNDKPSAMLGVHANCEYSILFGRGSGFKIDNQVVERFSTRQQIVDAYGHVYDDGTISNGGAKAKLDAGLYAFDHKHKLYLSNVNNTIADVVSGKALSTLFLRE